MKAWTRPEVPVLDPSPGRPRVHDTASGQLVTVGPDDGAARLYVCGITPVSYTHLDVYKRQSQTRTTPIESGRTKRANPRSTCVD